MKNESSSKKLGDLGETVVRNQVRREGKWSRIFSIENNSGHGTDIIAMRGTGNTAEFKVIEVKYNKSELSKLQKMGGKEHTTDSATAASMLYGSYKVKEHVWNRGWSVVPLTDSEGAKILEALSKAQSGLSQGQIDRLLEALWQNDEKTAAKIRNRPGRVEYFKARVSPDGSVRTEPWTIVTK